MLIYQDDRKLKSEGHSSLHIKGQQNTYSSLDILSFHEQDSLSEYTCHSDLQKADVTCRVKFALLAVPLSENQTIHKKKKRLTDRTSCSLCKETCVIIPFRKNCSFMNFICTLALTCLRRQKNNYSHRTDCWLTNRMIYFLPNKL